MEDNLRKTAEEEKITLNSLTNQIFNQFVKWDSSASKAGMIPLPKVLLVKIMDKLSKEDIIKLAEYMVTNEIKDIILVLRTEHSINSFLDVVEAWAKTSGFPYIHEDLGGSTHKYVITHDMGKNWSLYFGIIFTRILEELKVPHVNCEFTDKTLIFSYTHIV